MGLLRHAQSAFVVVVLLCSDVSQANAATLPPANYSYSLVASSGAALGSISHFPSLNNDGTVAFTASDNGWVSLYTASPGEAPHRVADRSGPLYNLFLPAEVNDRGDVAFLATADAGGDALYTADRSGRLTKIADTRGTLSSLGSFRMNNAGAVVFQAGRRDGGTGIFVGDAKAEPRTIAADDGPFADFTFARPSINDVGTVAFRGRLDGGRTGVYVSDGLEHRLVADESGPLEWLERDPLIRNSGRVTFQGDLDGTGFAIMSRDADGREATVVDTTGPFSSFYNFGSNERGETAFGGFLDRGGLGIFVGPDPVRDRVITVGETLFGQTISDLGFIGSINDAGQVAFWFGTNGSANGIVLATPLPEPSGAGAALMLVAAALRGQRQKRELRATRPRLVTAPAAASPPNSH